MTAPTERWFVVVCADGDRYEVAELIPNAKPYPTRAAADEVAVRLRSAREDRRAAKLGSAGQ